MKDDPSEGKVPLYAGTELGSTHELSPVACKGSHKQEKTALA